MKEKRIITILVVFAIIFTFFGASLAYWNWETSEAQRTRVVFTVGNEFQCAADGGGNITSEQVSLVPTDCTNTEYAIQRTVKVNPTIYKNDLSIYMDLWLQINNIGSGLSNSQNFRYALTKSPTSCTTGVVSQGNFNGKTNVEGNNTVQILAKSYMGTITETYYLYIWLDKAETSQTTMNQSFDLSLNGNCSQELYNPPEKPVLDAGMIPVTISEDGVATTVSKDDPSWYDYSNKEWANVVLVNKDATEDVNGSHSREYYKNNPGTPVVESDILAYYVWIPRYKYAFSKADGNPEAINIVFESVDADISVGTATGNSYYTHPAFVWDGETVAGIWVGKFETGHSSLSSSTTSNNLGCTDINCTNADGLIIKPNVQILRYNNVSNFFFASRSMTKSTNPFGLDASTTDSHMMKNSEWGAFAYLSHSKFGINQQIYLNNSSGFYTGRSGGNVAGSVDTIANHYDGQTSSKSVTKNGYYTWIGQEIDFSGTIGGYASDRTLGTNASTTGNVTGIYDMVSVGLEYVMGVLADSSGNPRSGNSSTNNSGFYGLLSDDTIYNGIPIPPAKYYDLYTTSDKLTACNGHICYGHSLSETYRWYGEYDLLFVLSQNPWFSRGGYLSYTSTMKYYSASLNGAASASNSTRFVLIVDNKL